MTIKPKRLFSNLFLWAIFLIALFSIIFLVIGGYNAVAFFIAIFSFLFLLFNMIGVPYEFVIEKDEIIFKNKSYKLTDDLKNYVVKSEMIWYKNVKLPNELLILRTLNSSTSSFNIIRFSSQMIQAALPEIAE